jgi:hypothetical protein
MTALADVARQCLAVKKVLVQFRNCVRDDYFLDVLTATIRTLDAYELELRPWVKYSGVTGGLCGLAADKVVDVCRLRLELLSETLQDALAVPLPGQLRQQLLFYLYEYSDIKVMVECILEAVTEAKDVSVLRQPVPTPPAYEQHALSA